MIGENFPYTNFHDLNMDWIIKIAKDFLDQYTNIQTTITNGLTAIGEAKDETLRQLQDSYEEIERLLNAWYEEHSTDIANELADALATLNNWYTIHQGYLDDYLTTSIAAFNTAAQNKAAETIADIPSGYTQLSNEVIQNSRKLAAISPNLFNYRSTDIQTTRFLNGSGYVANSGSDPRYGTSHPIFVKGGTEYKFTGAYLTYGSSAKYVAYVTYPGDMAVSSISSATPDSDNNLYTWTAPDDGWVVFNILRTQAGTIIFAPTEAYPNALTRYENINANILMFIPNADEPEVYKYVAVVSNNLFDKSGDIDTEEIITGGHYVSISDIRYGIMHPIYVTAGHTYKCKAYQQTYGSNAKTIAYINNVTDKQIISVDSTGTVDTDDMLTWTAPSSGFIIKNILLTDIDWFMFCEASVYPSYYMRKGLLYYLPIVEYSPAYDKQLAYKTVVCLGDSIAYGGTDEPNYVNVSGAWFARLRDRNLMLGKNYAVNGASITYLGENRHCICRDIDTVYSEYPAPDYVLLEGGTNDADLISGNYGTWSPDDFTGNYDDTTFCGAVETLFYGAITKFPTAKIGYIVAMQMGTTSTSSNRRKAFFDEIVAIARKWHIPVLNLWETLPADARLTQYFLGAGSTYGQNVQNRSFYADGQHPLSFGYDKMQNRIVEWMRGL